MKGSGIRVCLISLLNLLPLSQPLLPHRSILAALLGGHVELASQPTSLLGCRGKKCGPGGSRAAIMACSYEQGWQTGLGGGKNSAGGLSMVCEGKAARGN